MDNGRQRGSKPPGSPQLFRANPPKKGGHPSDALLLSPDVLDDATRRELLQDVLRQRRASLSPVGRLSGPGAVAGDVHTDKEPFAHQLRARVRAGSSANSDNLVAAMAARLKDLESKQKAYQAELQELHAKYRQLNDNYHRERELREEAETAVLTLYDEKELLEAQLREKEAAHARASNATNNHPPPPLNRVGKVTHSTQASPSHAPVTPLRAVKVDLFSGNFKDHHSDDGAKATGKAGPTHRVDTGRPDTVHLTPQRVGGLPDNRNAASAVAGSSPKPPHSRHSVGTVDVELLTKNARILSDYVGWKGVVREGNQAGIRERDAVRVVVYKNGICVNQGPFRPYGWALCDAFLDDLIEGFYPYEFKERYPDGFPIEVVDRTSETCETHRIGAAHGSGVASLENAGPLFPKEGGRRLGGARPNSGRNPHRVHTLDEQKKNIDYAPVSAEEFLKKVPAQTMTAGGQLVSVRNDVAALMGVAATSSSASQVSRTIKHVSAAEVAYCQKVTQQQRSASLVNAATVATSSMFVGNLIAVLIRLPNGQKIKLHMAPEDTVAALRKEFVAAAPNFQTVRYELYQAFPLKQEWNDHQLTFASLGVKKSCTLMVKLIK
ncbi:conserved hypothetical protein [Leishmania braziliensis MHOM/BR/75/M2904]|uniref:UBX domain-containing protein 11 n=2 Tax=Leishmania braziliensis TaxID=5660 RepID=A4HQ59_LEIBR|nr:conserved hypothetical protein [Leishmania braziliensis MHOM/BR/75/M2904]KAI5691601.1 SEP domain containing protein [Leishmania braziliensis]CAJ2482080.1 unnamed protein product [Leishmania braziliensis]CAM44323.2 conserved hypothetical protein [Leishmania braziliensis MHOM/BR/75/M2904]SYZ70400.1 SEP_domain/UBX_domain_containing_protein [Leishmania braziliensis MHOM/BR/75/M2904]